MLYGAALAAVLSLPGAIAIAIGSLVAAGVIAIVFVLIGFVCWARDERGWPMRVSGGACAAGGILGAYALAVVIAQTPIPIGVTIVLTVLILSGIAAMVFATGDAGQRRG